MGLVIGSPVMKPEENGVARDVVVRRARLSDSEAIAALVNAARSVSTVEVHREVSRLDVAERFGQVGFMIAEREGRLVGVLGWQVENLVVRVTDFLIASAVDPMMVGRALVGKMETEAMELQAEAVVLFLPSDAGEALVAFWTGLGYAFQDVAELYGAWREAVAEQGLTAERVMLKHLREGLILQPV